MQYFRYTWNYRNWLCFVSFLKFRSTKLCKRLKTFCQYFVKFCKKFAIMKLLSSLNCFDNFKTGHVSDFAIHKTTKPFAGPCYLDPIWWIWRKTIGAPCTVCILNRRLFARVWLHIYIECNQRQKIDLSYCITFRPTWHEAFLYTILRYLRQRFQCPTKVSSKHNTTYLVLCCVKSLPWLVIETYVSKISISFFNKTLSKVHLKSKCKNATK